MKPTPSDWPRMSSAVVYQDAAAATHDWKRELRSPKSVAGANTQSIMFFVDDAQAHCAHARSRGARIVEEPAVHDYGEAYWADLSYCAMDPEGHYWWITQRLRTAART